MNINFITPSDYRCPPGMCAVCDGARAAESAVPAAEQPPVKYATLGTHFEVRESDPGAAFRDDGSVEVHDPLADAVLAEEMRRGMGLKPALEPQLLPSDSAERKRTPVYSGVIKYFPRAMAYIAQVSWAGNEKHNPGEPLHWARGKSTDHLDCIARHLIDAGRYDPEDGFLHDGKLAWRALANLEETLEKMEAK